MSFHWQSVAAILAMALATYATRIGGLYLMQYIPVRGRMRAALDALPPAILMAVIAPTVLLTGPAETVASAITLAAALLRVPLILTMLIGVVSVVGLRLVM
jgi:uncharacterized membrane protein